ncbi:NAD(P)-dependent alcohol dehydrogenase [Novosphingobium bradum]|uniref:NAD(P)-dependent alcohol dehydrogenase n=1 Tax=Novosphingobium bradum TaxID=1737444 RepID=A0ABV7IR14_9SPHN
MGLEVTAAVALDRAGPFEIRALTLDDPRPDEVVVRIAAVGLCHTDLVFKAGAGGYPVPAVFGHEGAGVVERVGSAVGKVKVGDRVLMTFRSCGTCDRCLAGDPAYCRTWLHLNCAGCRMDGSTGLGDGEERIASNFFGQSSFASHGIAYERNVVKVPDDLPLELLAPLGCGVQTGVGAVMRSLDARAGSSIVIAGGGAVGLCAVMGAAIRKLATIIVVEPHARRRALALELGATHVIDPADHPDTAAAVREIVPQGVDFALDTSGVPPVMQALAAALGSKGTLGLVGIATPGTPVPGDAVALVTFGQTVKGIIEGDSDPDEFLPELVALYRSGALPLDRIVRTYPLAEINQAVADQHAGLCVKAVLLP